MAVKVKVAEAVRNSGRLARLQGRMLTVSELLIITGPPGSGKSTVSRLVAEHFDRSALVAGDSFFRFVVRGYIDPWLPESHDQNVVVTEAAARAAGRYPRGGYMTIFDGMVGPWFLPTFLEYADLELVHFGVLMPSLDVCLARVLDREGHGFRDERATRHMYRAFEDARIDDRHVVANTRDAPSVVAREVLEALRTWRTGLSVGPWHGPVIAWPTNDHGLQLIRGRPPPPTAG